MDILILGGTVFLGRALVEAARLRGHRITLFNRGQSNPALFPEVEQLHGDRKVDLSALDGRQWDAAIDTCGYVPRHVRLSVEKLNGAVGHYTFISSISVYAETSQPGQDESAPLTRLVDEAVEEVNGDTYGGLKALCEQAVQQTLPGRALVIRPGLIVGPYDPTDRFTYWPYRLAQGGEVLCPGTPESPAQVIDVRDLADWTLSMVESRGTGIYNADSPAGAITLGELLETCREASQSNATFTWASDSFLAEQGVQPWSEMPVWVPASDPANAGFFAFDCRKAAAAGLTIRPLAETAADTLAWAKTRSPEHAWRAGLSQEREVELLGLWHKM